MNKIEVIVRSKTELELKTDAKAGDIIDLNELTNVDTSYIDRIIQEHKDIAIEKRLEAERENFNNQLRSKESENEAKIIALKNENVQIVKNKELEFENKNKDKINELNQRIKELENKIETERIMAGNRQVESQNKLKLDYDVRIKDLQSQLEASKNNKDLEIANEVNKLELSKNEEINELNKKVSELTNAYNLLKSEKSMLNSKNLGESLEQWCTNEVASYMQNGLFNCTWEKDNDAVKEEGENKGSKGDFIFKVYATNEHKPEQLLTSISLEMKDENPESKAKHTNKDHYEKLDKDRKKKNCEYALLVSNLETDKSNDIPIYKVNEYEKMYVVRPAYMMTFLNMVTSLCGKFTDLLSKQAKDELELKTKEDIVKLFDNIKNTYLEKPLESLEKKIDEIDKSTTNIISNANKIQENVDAIKRSYINEIENKIERFDVRLEKNVLKQL